MSDVVVQGGGAPELEQLRHSLAVADHIDELGAAALGRRDQLAPEHAAGAVVQQPLVRGHVQVLQEPWAQESQCSRNP